MTKDRKRPNKMVTCELRLDGYPAYDRALSGHHPACWEVQLAKPGKYGFRHAGITLYSSENWTEAKKIYDRILSWIYP